MHGTPSLTAVIDLDYVAMCLAEQIVRVRISAGHFLAGSQSGKDPSALLTGPLYAVAASLGIEARVATLVDESLTTVA